MKIEPNGFHVLVRMEEVAKQSGGIILPQSVVDSEQLGYDRGTVVAIGPTAFLAFRGAQEGKTPEERGKIWGFGIGDTIMFHKNAGKLLQNTAQPGQGEDVKYLRLITDQQIMARIGD